MTWRAERNSLGLTLLVCLVIGAIFVWLMPGCTPARSAADVEKCLAAADARAELEIAKRCATATLAECPSEDEIMAAWEVEARRCR